MAVVAALATWVGIGACGGNTGWSWAFGLAVAVGILLVMPGRRRYTRRW